jgi:hypothetical protein
MELDEMKTMWEAYDRKLDTSIRLSKELLKAPVLRKAKGATTRLLIVWQIELALACIALALIGGFTWMHILHPRFVFSGLLLMILAIVLVSTYVRRILAVRAIDFSGPIVGIQKQMEAIRIAEIRATKWTLLLAPLAWTPFLVVLFQGLFHVDVFAVFPPGWLLGNVLFGVLLIVLERWISHRYAERMQNSPRLQRWMRDLNGYNLKAATSFMHRAAEFEEEARA